MADQFSIEAKLKITGVDVKGDLNAGTLKFKVDTSALKKLVSDAAISAKKVKAKFDNIKLNKLKIEINKNSLRSAEAQIRNAVQNAVKKTKLDLTANVSGGTKADPFKAQRLAAGKSAQSLQTLHDLTKQVNSGLRSLTKTLGSISAKGPIAPAAAAAPKGNLPFPAGARTVSVGDLGGGGGGRRPGPGVSPGGAGRGGEGLRDAARGIQEITNGTKKANKEMVDLNELTFQVGKKAAAFRGVAIAINTVVNAAQAAAKFIIDFNDSLIEVNKILQLSDAALARLGDDLFALSAKTGVAIDETIAISEAFARAGLAGRGYGSIAELTDRALTGMQGTTLDASQTTELFIQVLQQVEGGVRGLGKELITSAKLFDVLGKAENITASKATDVQAAFKRSAASIFATGVTIEQATTLISVLQERTQRGGDVIGTALKTLASRISSSTSEATKALNAIGVETIDAQGNLRNLFDVLQDTAVAFNNLTEAEQANVAVKAAGIRQVEVFRAAVQDFNRMQEINTKLVNASGDAARKQAVEQSKLANVLSKLQIALQQLIKTASEGIIGEAFVFAITAVEKLVTGIANLDKILKGTLSTFGGILAIALGMKVLLPMLGGIGRAMKFFIGFTKQAGVAMGELNKGGAVVAATADGRMVPALERVAMATANANTQMQALSASTLFAASQAERLAKNQGLAQPVGGAVGVAGRAQGNTGRRGVDIVQTTGRAGGAAFLASKQIGILGKTAGLASKAWGALGKIGLGLATVFTIAGGAAQAWGQTLRDEGSKVSGAFADIGGGILGGVGTGAAIGSFIPVIGTAIGAAIGGIAGAIAPTLRTIDSFSDGIKDLGKEYVKLGIIQKENGQITSDVAEKLDKALRNLESFKGLETGSVDLKNLFDPEGAAKRAKEQAKAEQSAIAGVLSTFDPADQTKDQNKLLVEALNKILISRGAGKDLDLGAPEALKEGSPLFARLGQKSLDQVEAAMITMADEFGILPDKVREIVEANKQRIEKARLTPQQVTEAQALLDKQTDQFADFIKEIFPKTGGAKTRKRQGELQQTLINIAEGEGGELATAIINGFIKRAKEGDLGQVAFAKGAGGEAEALLGKKGADAIASALERAQKIQDEREAKGKTTVAAAIPGAVKDFFALARPAVGEDISRRRIEGAVGTQEEITGIIKSLRSEFPIDRIGDFIDRPVSKLELALRNFVADFSREVTKLQELQTRAITPQQQLTQALAQNADASLKSIQRRIALEKADATQRARDEFTNELKGEGERLFKSVDALRGAFAAEGRDIGAGAAGRIAQEKITFSDLFGDPKNLTIEEGQKKSMVARIFGVDEATAKEIAEKSKRQVGDSAAAVFDALLQTNRQIAAKGIQDPDAQRELQQQALVPLAGDVSALSDEQFQKVSDTALKFSKALVELDAQGFQAVISRNAKLLAALKDRISEEERVLAVDQRRREAAALTARIFVEELTGIRRLVAERQIEANLLNESIAAQQGHIASLDEEIAKLRQTEQEKGKSASTTERIILLERKRADASIELTKDVAKQQTDAIRNIFQVAKLAVTESKKVAGAERKRISTLADINSLLSVDQNEMNKFNAELENIGQQFRVSQAELAAEAQGVIASTQSQAEKDAQLADIRRRGAGLALDQAKAEAQIIAKRREAIKQVSQELLNNQSQQVDAQKAIIDATKGVADAFENYLQAVDGAVMATTRYNLGLALARVETTRITGGFSGLREQIGVVQDAFRDAERLARDLGASEKTLVQIRRDSINQQLALFNNLLQEQSQLARSFFTSSTQDQADLFLGIREAGNVADLLGGSFETFKGKGEAAINDLGAQLLALPQETRQRVISSLETLKTVGGTVGGFTADELLTAIETAALGVSGEGLQVDPLFEVQQRIAALQEEQARLATEQLIASNEQVTNAKEQLEQAEAAKDLAEIQLERLKEEGEKLRGKLSNLQGDLKTTLLQQEQTQRQGFNAVTSAVARAANAVITQLPDAFSVRVAEAFREVMREGGLSVPTQAPQPGGRPTPPTKGKEMADAQRAAGRDRAALQQQIQQAGPSVSNQQSALGAALPGAGGDQADANLQTIRRLEDILGELQNINSTSEANLAVTEEIRDSSGNQLGTANATITGTAAQPEITINVEGTTTVTVTGFEAGVARLATTLAETLGGFVSEEEARRIANEVLENIRTELLRRGIITPTTL